MSDIIRDAPLGQLIRFLTNNKYFQYPEEKQDFKLPDTWLTIMNDPNASFEESPSNGALAGPQHPRIPPQTLTSSAHGLEVDEEHNMEDANKHIPILPRKQKTLKATLGLAIYVLGYGVGPLVFSPLSEIASIGRNPIYIITTVLFVVISIPTALVDNYPVLIVLRFLQGVFGSPCLASGGASLGDMFSPMALPYAMAAWVFSTYSSLGPLLSGFSVPARSWRWSLYESLWISSPILILMFVLFPETSEANILLRRAKRLRILTGNACLVSQSEIDQRHMTITIRDPAVLFVQIYTAILYGIYYSFFEAFPRVYPVFYGMNLGQTGLVFICVLIARIIGATIYVAYFYYYVNPRIAKYGWPVQEDRLVLGLPASFGPVIGLFLFAWTARESDHWIVPTIGIAISSAATFILMQYLFVYIPLSYPEYIASLFAANDPFRSGLACASILFAQPLFDNLGIAKLLGGLSIIGIIGIFLLYVYGAKLRSLSNFAKYEPAK
ncbi:hypothetical protein FSARC_13098 [Fusarium sarcochroum]|uniref:Major facilitator superfamily (MFS) profile domain-containing protein n=1 Tax=Fusarium sarcochroum TaxID=1208366 RepID=A0A8H4T3U1_9HYPO|nr:hypothetical protein FSARC_13098 [Fusarium sarcochroum]